MPQFMTVFAVLCVNFDSYTQFVHSRESAWMCVRERERERMSELMCMRERERDRERDRDKRQREVQSSTHQST